MIANASVEPNDDVVTPAASANPLAALVVSTDRSLQRRLHQYLQEAGYRSIHTASVAHALALVESADCHFLLVDADLSTGDALELCREAGTTPRGGRLTKLLLQANNTGVDFADLLHAGIDDILMKPPSYLELVARLRAAARTHEFRRRMEVQLGLDPLTHLLDEQSFRREVGIVFAANVQQVHSCLAVTLDHCQEKSACEGMQCGQSVLISMAEVLRREQLENEVVSHWGQGRFYISCAGQGKSESTSRAEELSQALLEALAEDQASFPISISVGVADSRGVLTPDELIEHSNEALQSAQSSGGGCVTSFGEFDNEFELHRELDSTGNVFQNTCAGDLMSPCVLTFSESNGVWQAACLMQRHRLSAAPLVDPNGKCVGILEAGTLPDTPDEAGNKNVFAYRSTNAEMCGEETVLGDIMKRLSESDTMWLVITRHGRPTGLISRDQLAAFSHPFTVESLREGSVQRPRVRFEELLVPQYEE